MNASAAKFGYKIQVRGHLDQHWKAWFDGWTITDLENGDTLLVKAEVDRPGVHGVLTKIRDLNLVLISVLRIPAEGGF